MIHLMYSAAMAIVKDDISVRIMFISGDGQTDVKVPHWKGCTGQG